MTIQCWSFPREDISKKVQLQQLALALRDEIADLEKAGIVSIQMDEPALREGLPLRKSDWNDYLGPAVDSFRLAAGSASDSVNLASHFCYSDFNDVIEHVFALDCDMLSVENSKSDAKLLRVFTGDSKSSGVNDIGPGIFDIHSPRVPSSEEQYQKLAAIVAAVGKDKVWVNPDCGLKTRTWPECEAQLKNMVAAAQRARKELA